MNNDILVFIPTYNEKENVVLLHSEIQKLGLKLDILFIDDNSPDGTGDILNSISKKNKNVKVIHRSGKLGIGTAHQDGIKYAYDKGYKKLITMDSDFTHPPSYIPELLRDSDKKDIIVGSRYLEKKSLEGWNLLRKLLTIFGHLLTRFLLRIKYDATGAFRVYNIKGIPHQVFNLVSSKGYSFLYESLFILNANKFTISEIPIKLPVRTYGHSKMRISDAFQSFSFLFSIYLNSIINMEKYLVVKTFIRDTKNTKKIEDPQDWDSYWKTQKSSGGLLYDAIAAFYRKNIIKKALTYFVKKYFNKDSRVLHAGCGSGQVDYDIVDYIDITAMDISINALNIYKTIHGEKCQIKNGSIFDTKLKNESFDGIYNLGVMEHFTEYEINQILNEFRRILKKDGRLLIFWPPEYGLSVMFLKGVKFILEKIFKKNEVKFHPDEITRLKSRKHAFHMLEKSGFQIIKYYFGIRDFFTSSVIVAEKQ